MRKIINWILGLQLRWRKEKLLFEVNQDLLFIRRSKANLLTCDTESLRSKLAAERKKEGGGNQKLIAELSEKIAMAEAVRNEVEKLSVLARELPEYIKFLC